MLWGGVPAKIIRYRFNEDISKKMIKIAWWNWTDEQIKSRLNEFMDVKAFVEKYYEE